MLVKFLKGLKCLVGVEFSTRMSSPSYGVSKSKEKERTEPESVSVGKTASLRKALWKKRRKTLAKDKDFVHGRRKVTGK